MVDQGQSSFSNPPIEVEDSPLYGVSLRQYAAIRAALTEGFSVDEVLRKERVERYDWERAERKWLARLTAHSALAERLKLELAAAEDWLWRDIEPLQEDATAWAAFYAACAAAPQKEQWLAKKNIGTNDISRLVRHWSRKAAKDPELAKRLAQLPSNPVVPTILAKPKVLKRMRRGPSAADEVIAIVLPSAESNVSHAKPDDLDVFVFGVDRYAALTAELEVFPKERERIRKKYNLASEADYDILAQRMRDYLHAQAEHERDYRRHHQLALARAKKLAETTTTDERAETTRKSLEAETTTPSYSELRLSDPVAPVLPIPPIAELNAVAPIIAEKPAAASPTSGSSGATQDVSSLFAAIAADPLPFTTADAKESTEETIARIEAGADAAEKEEPPKPVAPPEVGGTQDVSAIFAKVELPAGWKAQSPAHPETASAPKDSAADKPRENAVVKPIEVTTPPAGARAPEPPKVSPTKPPVAVAVLPELSVEHYAYLCIELEVRPDRTAEVLARYQVPRESLETLHAVWRQRLNFDNAAKTMFARVSTDYKIWLAGQGRTKPRLTTEQYASLLVDLSNAPAQRANTLHRYGLDEASKTALDQAYQKQFEADPRAYAAFTAATNQYRAWLTQNR